MSGVSLDAKFYHRPLKYVAGALINISSSPIEELKTKPTRFRYKVTRAPLSLSLIFSSPPLLFLPVRLPLSSLLHLAAAVRSLQLPRLRSSSATQTLTQTDLIGLSLFWEVWAYLPLPAGTQAGKKVRDGRRDEKPERGVLLPSTGW